MQWCNGWWCDQNHQWPHGKPTTIQSPKFSSSYVNPTTPSRLWPSKELSSWAGYTLSHKVLQFKVDHQTKFTCAAELLVCNFPCAMIFVQRTFKNLTPLCQLDKIKHTQSTAALGISKSTTWCSSQNRLSHHFDGWNSCRTVESFQLSTFSREHPQILNSLIFLLLSLSWAVGKIPS